MEALDQAGREALKKEMAADYSRSSAYIREVTSRIDKDYKAELREIAFDMWMACFPQQEIAKEIGYSADAIGQFLKSLRDPINATGGVYRDLSKNDALANLSAFQEFNEEEEEDDPNSLGVYRLDKRLLIKANHLDGNYKPPIYNIWKQQEKTEGGDPLRQLRDLLA
jgi:hypothetical protein